MIAGAVKQHFQLAHRLKKVVHDDKIFLWLPAINVPYLRRNN
jgi:hypothetical protein